jgi:NitT/TauT family transport system ATP-binding protein
MEVIETGWDRERDSRLVETPKFGQITARLWKLLRQESFKAIGKGKTAS